MGERRKFIRAGAPFLLDVSCPSENRAFEAYGWSLGRGGVGFYADVPLPVDVDVSLRVMFVGSGGEKPPETVEATTRWVKTISNGYAVGAEFKELDEERHFVLLAYLDHAETMVMDLSRHRLSDH